MRILLFSNWSIHDGLTQGTVFSLMRSLNSDEKIERIYFSTIESYGVASMPIPYEKAVHAPLHTSGKWMSKARNVICLPFRISAIIKRERIDLIWCKGASAGAMGVLAHWISGAKLVVDSFEPHAEYMAQSGTWSRLNPKFLIQRWLEHLTMRSAIAILPVSEQFKDELVKRGLAEERIFVTPCVIDPKKFDCNAGDRHAIRAKLKVKEPATIGIYVGKFGGLYYESEAFHLYKQLFRHFGQDFFLIIITECDAVWLRTMLRQYEFPLDRIFFSRVPHSEVASFLCAADFGISTIKSVPAMRYCSPIKHGEYWAADLPILSTLKFGDDAVIIGREAGGVLCDASSEENMNKLEELSRLLAGGRKGHYTSLARKYRDMSILQEAVQFVLNKAVTFNNAGD